MQRFLFYLISTLLIGTIIYVGMPYLAAIREQANLDYEMVPVFITASVAALVLGMLLKVPSLVRDWNETTWGFDWKKLLGVALPSVYMAFLPLWALLPTGQPLPFMKHAFIAPTGFSVQTVAGIVLGYCLVSSFRVKEKETISNKQTEDHFTVG